ncbi:MAG: DNA recombination/repair protein RecA, partial [Thaumarchaeota archaeon]|nr:DNA recombination/repair protein RecA [Nitrososphaerota archaeon]
MSRGALQILFRPPAIASTESRSQDWNIGGLAGRLCELSEGPAGGAVTAAFRLVLQAQQSGEPSAWFMDGRTTFFPPDAAEGGVDLDALVLVRLP